MGYVSHPRETRSHTRDRIQSATHTAGSVPVSAFVARSKNLKDLKGSRNYTLPSALDL